MATIEEIRQQTLAARALAQQKRQEAQAIQQQLDEQERQIPDVSSQQSLRSRYSGQQGRQFRALAEEARQQIAERKGEVSRYEQEVITPYEEQISQSEQNIQSYDEDVRAIEKAKAMYERRLPYDFAEGKTKEYLKGFYQEERAQDLFNAKLGQAVEAYNQGVPKEQAFKGLNTNYLEKKGYLKFEQVDVDQANQYFADNTLQNLQNAQANYPRDPDKIDYSGGSMFPLVSAQEVKSGEAWQVQPAPSFLGRLGQFFKKEVKESGDVPKAVLTTAGAALQTSYDIDVQRGNLPPQQYEAFMNIYGSGPSVAAYASPAGPALMVGSGVSRLIAYNVKPEILNRQAQEVQQFTGQYGLNIGPKTSKSLVVGGALAEGALGLFGLRGQISGLGVGAKEGTQAFNLEKNKGIVQEEFNPLREAKLDIAAGKIRQEYGIKKISDVYYKDLQPTISSFTRGASNLFDTGLGKIKYYGERTFGRFTGVPSLKSTPLEQGQFGRLPKSPLYYDLTPEEIAIIQRVSSREGGLWGLNPSRPSTIGNVIRKVGSRVNDFEKQVFGTFSAKPRTLAELKRLGERGLMQFDLTDSEVFALETFGGRRGGLLGYARNEKGILDNFFSGFASGISNKVSQVVGKADYYGDRIFGTFSAKPRTLAELRSLGERGLIQLDLTDAQAFNLETFGGRRGGLLGFARNEKGILDSLVGSIFNKASRGISSLGSRARYYEGKLFGDLPNIKGNFASRFEDLEKFPLFLDFSKTEFKTRQNFFRIASQEGGVLGSETKPIRDSFFKNLRFPVINRVSRNIDRFTTSTKTAFSNRILGRIEQVKFRTEAWRRALFPSNLYSRRMRGVRERPGPVTFVIGGEPPSAPTPTAVIEQATGGGRPSLQLESPRQEVITTFQQPEFSYFDIPSASRLAGGIFGLSLPSADFISISPSSSISTDNYFTNLIDRAVANLPVSKTRPKLSQEFKSIPEFSNKILDAQAFKPFTSVKQSSRIRQEFKQREEQRKKKLGVFWMPKKEQGSAKSPLTSAFDKLGFDIFVRRRGKEVRVGTAGTTGQARQELFTALKGSLAASGVVREKGTGRKVKLDFLGGEFTPSKIDPFRVVQRRGFRLGTSGERGEIRRARQVKGFGLLKKGKKSRRIRWF